MTSQNKIEGYTILEIVVTMVIASIIIAICYTLLALVSSEWKVFQKKQDNLTDLIFFKETLDKDIENCNYILQEEKHLYYFISEKDTVKYFLEDQVVRHKKGNNDTFNIKAVNVHCLFIDGTLNIVSSLSFKIAAPLNIESTTFSKSYSSAQIVNIPPNLNAYEYKP